MPLALPIDPDARRRDPSRPWYRFAASLLPAAPGRWIDLGCGRGEFLALAAAGGRAGLGLERERAAAAQLAGEGRSVLVADLGRGLPFRDAAFDGASLVEVIEHVLAAEALVAELARVVRPGGWLLVTTPNVVHWRYRWRTLIGRPPKQEGRHVRFFTRRTLARLLARGGFAPRRRASFGRRSLLGRLGAFGGRRARPRYRVPSALEGLLAQHFVWLLTRAPAGPA